MIKALLFDIDGVLLRHDSWFFRDFARDYGEFAFETLLEYCEGKEIVECDKGFRDSHDAIWPFLMRIGYKGTVEHFYDEKNAYEKNGIDHIALEKIEYINRNKISCFIGSNQDKRRRDFLFETLDLGKIVKEAYFSCDFGYVKPEKEYWEITHKKIANHVKKIKANEILFFDDREENTKSAKAYGFEILHVKSKEDLHIKIDEILS